MSVGARGQDICDRTRAFASRIIKLYRVLVKDEVGRVIGKQMLRCGTSIGANVEEAQAGQSRADFIHKMTIALKETRETKYWLTLALDADLIPAQRLDSILQETDEIAKIIFTITKNAKTNKP